ncbi:MAG: type II toxin-antitoxin system HicB family antitoxin [Christensenellaceae bacterium]|jgi:predicted RNase H-like HicB family nuclease|nr:type II toxin-antitoxin system HicB family antitoxin [Christensenellaceae bacterium]
MVVYPAIFTKEGSGYWVRFPDLDGCLTEGDNLTDAVKNSEEALGGYIASLIKRNIEIPTSSEFNKISTNNKNESIVMISSNMDKYLKKPRLVKKNLTIPEYLSVIAEQQNINFSAVLTEALAKKLKVAND